MNRVKKMVTIFSFMFLVWCLIGMAGTNKVADVSIGSYGIHFLPKVSYGQIVLTVSRPDGTVYKKTFASGTNPYFDLTEGSRSHSEGSYTYELRVIPFTNKVREPGTNLPDKQLQGNTHALTQSGAFTVSGGAIVTPGASEAGENIIRTQGNIAQPLDQVFIDDLIVEGSICAGFDCVNGENFGFDTLILKENNLRIYFNDTSNSGSFPSNDWRITANDSTNGGANRFSIDDASAGRTPFTIEAGAPANSLYVEDGGRIGFGTATPVVELHIADGDTPTVRLDQDGSSGWSPQVWDVAGNEANFFIRDVTHGSKLPFRIKPSAPTNSIFVAADGSVGMGTETPDYSFQVERTGANAAVVATRTDGASNFINATTDYANFGSATSHPVRILVDSVWKMRINVDGTIDMADGGSYDGNWNPASSRALKENIEDLGLEEALNAVENLNPVKYNYKKNKEEARVGFIAEDVPELVANNGRKNLATVDIMAVLTKVVQEQQKTIFLLNERISKLEKKSEPEEK